MCDNYDIDKCKTCLTKNGCDLKPLGIFKYLFVMIFTISVTIIGVIILSKF